MKVQSTSKSTPVRTAIMSKTFGEYKYCGSNKHHPDDCKFYPGCEICGSIAHEIVDCPKNLRNSRKQRIAIKQSEPTKKWTHDMSETISAQIFKRASPKVVFGDDSSGDIEGYGSVSCNGITFTRVAYLKGLKHNIISISQLCDANFKVLFTKTQGTIFNQNDEVVLIGPRRRDVYIIDMMENLNEVRVKELRSDNGTEFRNHKLEEFCNEKGISQNFSSPCTPEQNGVAKKRTRTLIEAARTMLNSAKLPKQFWGEVINTACYTQNKSIIVKRHVKTAYDVFRGRAPDISYLHVFGCPVHIHNHRDHLGKFDEKADDGFVLGYSSVAKAFRVSFPEDEFIKPRTKDTQCSINIEYFPCVSAYENTTSAILHTLQNSVTSEDPSEFTIADDLAAIHEPDHVESAGILESTEP
ncbi:retrovirus-related pol polyprotein from transposon TNT 1-94 [Tanacetum coccineum]